MGGQECECTAGNAWWNYSSWSIYCRNKCKAYDIQKQKKMSGFATESSRHTCSEGATAQGSLSTSCHKLQPLYHDFRSVFPGQLSGPAPSTAWIPWGHRVELAPCNLRLEEGRTGHFPKDLMTPQLWSQIGTQDLDGSRFLAALASTWAETSRVWLLLEPS